MGSFIASDYGPQFTRNFTNTDLVWITSCNNNPLQYITFREDAKKSPCIVNYTDGAYIPSSHKLCRFLYRGGCLLRVRLTVANHVFDQHRICLLNLWLFGCEYYSIHSTEYTETG